MKAYKIHYDEELGHGAFGQVFAVTKKDTEEQLVVKVMLKKKLVKETIGTIQAEVSSLKLLNHENVIRLHDFIEDRCAYYIFMERIYGGELFDRIIKKANYTEAEARRVCKEILEGLDHCHRHNIVHRDIKPENLLLVGADDDSKIKIVDFGFSCVCHEPNLTEQLGTPIFMAPELWKHETYGKSVDMWAFGIVVYSLLSGFLPFTGENVSEISTKIVCGNVNFPDSIWQDVSADAKDFICQLLSVDVTKRLTTATALQHCWLIADEYELSRHSLQIAMENIANYSAQFQLRITTTTVLAAQKWRSKLKKFSIKAEDLPTNVEATTTTENSPSSIRTGSPNNSTPKNSQCDDAAVDEGLERLSLMAIREDDCAMSDTEYEAIMGALDSPQPIRLPYSPAATEYYTPLTSAPDSPPRTSAKALDSISPAENAYMTPINMFNDHLQHEITPIRLYDDPANNLLSPTSESTVETSIRNPLIWSSSSSTSPTRPHSAPHNSPSLAATAPTASVEIFNHARSTDAYPAPKTKKDKSSNCCIIQ